MLDTQAIYEDRRYISERQELIECQHPANRLWPFWPDWQICAACGEIVRPLDFIPFLAEHLLEVCYDAR